MYVPLSSVQKWAQYGTVVPKRNWAWRNSLHFCKYVTQSVAANIVANDKFAVWLMVAF